MKTALYFIGYVIYTVLIYLVYITDNLLLFWGTRAKVSFNKWKNNPSEKIEFYKVEYHNNLMSISFYRVFSLLSVYLIWQYGSILIQHFVLISKYCFLLII